MWAGAGKSVIRIPDAFFPAEGFNGVREPLCVRALILKCGEQQAALLSYEMTSLRDYAVSDARSLTRQITGIPESAVWVGVTHTFSAPHTRSRDALHRGDQELRNKNALFCRALDQALREALAQALDNLQQVRVLYGKGLCSANANRDEETPEGWWKGYSPREFSDHEVPAVSFVPVGENKPSAILFTFDVQSNQTEHSGMCSSDFAGEACRYIEQRTSAVALYFVGAAADQIPAPGSQGAELGAAVLQAVDSAREIPGRHIALYRQVDSYPGQQMPADMRSLMPDRSYCYKTAEQRRSAAERFDLDGVTFIGVKPELCSRTGSRIRALGQNIMVMTLINGGEKYMADALSYQRRTYEAMNSQFAEGAAEQLVKNLSRLLDQKEETQ